MLIIFPARGSAPHRRGSPTRRPCCPAVVGCGAECTCRRGPRQAEEVEAECRRSRRPGGGLPCRGREEAGARLRLRGSSGPPAGIVNKL